MLRFLGLRRQQERTAAARRRSHRWRRWSCICMWTSFSHTPPFDTTLCDYNLSTFLQTLWWTCCRSCDELTPWKHLLICLAVVFHRHLCLALCWWRYSQTFCWWPGRSSPLCPHCTSPRLRHDHGTATQHLTGEETESLILYEIYKYIYKKHFLQSIISIKNKPEFFFFFVDSGLVVGDLCCRRSLLPCLFNFHYYSSAG